MKTKSRLTLCCLILHSSFCLSAHAQGNAFTYQGRLTDTGNAYTGNAEFQATLWDAVSGGGQIAANSPAQLFVGVTNGLFILPLDFGANFPGANRWLQLEVRTNIGSFTTLAPRQQLTATPYAITAGNLTGTLPAAQLSGSIASANLAGTYSSALTLNNAANSFSGSGAGLTSLNASNLASGTVPDARLAANVARTNQVWLLGGNADTTPGTHFLGTTDNQAVEIKVNGMRALRLEPKVNDATHSNMVNVVGGSSVNFVGAGVYGATIGGGGALNYLGSARTNRVEADFGTVSGGALNTIQTDADFATIGGGTGNTIQTNAFYATIGGGVQNTMQTNAGYATIGGGIDNTMQASAYSATIGGGAGNTIQTNAFYATIGGGNFNLAKGVSATVGGGRQNNAGGSLSTCPGGDRNWAKGDRSFAAGTQAKAMGDGAFVWADSQNLEFAPGTANEVSFRCENGVVFTKDSAYTLYAKWTPGSAGWTILSDRNSKDHIVPVDGGNILEKIAQLPISEWNYIGYAQRHIGPMAQDFHALFPLNDDDKTLNEADLHGVALAAIQGLNQKVESENTALRAENAELKQRLEKIERLLNQLSGGGK